MKCVKCGRELDMHLNYPGKGEVADCPHCRMYAVIDFSERHRRYRREKGKEG